MQSTDVMNVQIPGKRPVLRRAGWLRETLETIVFVAVVYVLVELAAPRFLVDGPSMEPTFETSQRLIVDRMGYMLTGPERGDIVVFNAPGSGSDDPPLIKRVIGLPGDVIELRDTLLYINGELTDEPYINEPCETFRCQDRVWELSGTEYFVMGDNRNHSRDSRSFGPIDHSMIIGHAFFRYWPLQDVGLVTHVRFNPED